MNYEHTYTSAHALVDLGGQPSDSEIARLVQNYPTYQIVKRESLLKGLFDGSTHHELVLGLLTSAGLDASASRQSKGGYGREVVAKVRRATIRLLYLRYRLDEGMTRKQAHGQLLKKFSSLGKSSICKATHSQVLDGCTSL